TAAWMFMHCLMNTIFRHLRSIIPVTLFHFAWNLAGGNVQGGIWIDGYENGINTFLSGGIAIGLIAIIVWLISIRRCPFNGNTNR
ncbi:MAG: hypothetical protein FWC77_02735, partial [Defluviitaleaceae bacterium]|nr:hypothetical protein [Defluviitaleaceae bacterium]